MENATTCQTSAYRAANTTINVNAAVAPTAPAPWEMALTGSLINFSHIHIKGKTRDKAHILFFKLTA